MTTDPAPPVGPHAFGDATSATLAVPEGRLWLHVRAVDVLAGIPLGRSDWVTVGPVVSDRTPPRIRATRSPAADARGWSRRPVTVTFACEDANPRGPGWCPAPVTVGEGRDRVVSATATDLAGLRATASLTVSVDVTPPSPARPASPAAGATVASTRPEFRWSAASGAPAGIAGYEVVVAGRGVVATTRATRAVASVALPPGPVSWHVRATDEAGHAVASSSSVFVVGADPTARPPGGAAPTAVTAAPQPAAPGARPRASAPSPARGVAVNARRMRPRIGVEVRNLRPLLRWTRGPGGTRLYNVQVFEIRSGRLRPVSTALTRRTRHRVAPKRLRPGRQYVWRVWPSLAGTGYARKPLGVSIFRTPPRAPPPA
jgi:hypothetical protein